MAVPHSQWRLSTSGIKYQLIDGPSGSYDADKLTVTEIYRIRAVDLAAFALLSFPATVITGGSWYFLSNRVCPGVPRAYTKTVAFEGWDKGRPIDPYGSDPTALSNTYEEFLRITVTYETGADQEEEEDEDDPTNETFLKVSADASAEFLMIPSGGGIWTATAGQDSAPTQKPNLSVSKLVPMTEWTVSWPLFPVSLLQEIVTKSRSSIGMVNKSPVSLFWNAPAETILFTGMSYGIEFSWRELPQVDMEMKFIEKRVSGYTEDDVGGHNHFFRKGHGFRRLEIGGSRVYKSADLNLLFQSTPAV